MSYGNRFVQLTSEAAENAGQLVLNQLTERLNLSKHQTKNDNEMECLQFGICSYETHKEIVALSGFSNEIY